MPNRYGQPRRLCGPRHNSRVSLDRTAGGSSHMSGKVCGVRPDLTLIVVSLRPLPRDFFARKPRQVARELLGKVLVRRDEHGSTLSARIVEVEAYLGERDPAAHAAAGKTLRNSVIFGPPGHA